MTRTKASPSSATAGAPVSDLHPERHKFLLLDAIRGIAAAFIMLRHASAPLNRLVFPQSYLAVDLFFCLSGFVIAHSYDHRLGRSISFRRFNVMRVIRLYPLFALGVLFGLAFFIIRFFTTLHGHGLPTAVLLDLSPNLLFLPASHSTALFPTDVPGWSLLYELLANLAYALLWRLRAATSPLLTAIVLLAMGVLLAHGLHTHIGLDLGSNRSEWPWALARVASSFFLGVLLLRLFRAGFHPPRHARLSALLGLLCVAGTVLLLTLHVTPFAVPAYDLACALVLLPALVYAGAACAIPSTWQPLATFLGDYSYPLYILHSPLFNFLDRSHLIRVPRPLPSLLVGLLLASAMILFTWAIGRFYDVPLRKRLTALVWPRLPAHPPPDHSLQATP